MISFILTCMHTHVHTRVREYEHEHEYEYDATLPLRICTNSSTYLDVCDHKWPAYLQVQRICSQR